jgi:hypothetical protein
LSLLLCAFYLWHIFKLGLRAFSVRLVCSADGMVLAGDETPLSDFMADLMGQVEWYFAYTQLLLKLQVFICFDDLICNRILRYNID